jgi:hypothetical protein
MPDLLSHAFIAYTLATLLAARYSWLTRQYVTVAMAGAFIPDIAKATLIVDNVTIGNLLGVPFSWFGVHTLGGASLALLIGVAVTAKRYQRRVAGLLAIGASSHLFADALLLNVSGRSYPLFWPITRWAPPTPGLYLSTDLWPSITTGLIALVVWLGVRRPVHRRLKARE